MNIKRAAAVLLTAALLLFGTAVLTGCAEGASRTGQDSTITVHAANTVSAPPDIAHVSLGVRSTASTAQAAQQKNAEAAANLLDAIKGAGIDEADIETSNLNVYQDYENPAQYIAETSYWVTVRDINHVGNVIDAAVNGGANMSYSLSFDIEDKEALYVTALSNAVHSVQQKAQSLAAAGNYKITEVRSIEENSSGYYTADTAAYGIEGAVPDAGAGASIIAPDSISVSANVTGIFAIANA